MTRLASKFNAENYGFGQAVESMKPVPLFTPTPMKSPMKGGRLAFSFNTEDCGFEQPPEPAKPAPHFDYPQTPMKSPMTRSITK